MYRYQTKCGRARLLKSGILTEVERHASTHTLTIEVATLTRGQAEGLQTAFLEWLATLEFPRG